MKYVVAIYSPDQHICYNLHTLDDHGVGGGITARIRMAHALAEHGHEVTLYVNCPETEIIEGVRYCHYSQLEKIDVDVFIVSTSGGELDISSVRNKDIYANLRILMVHGVDPPGGIDLVRFDYIYALSNFVRDLIVERWGIKKDKIFVSHRGVKRDFYQPSGNRAPKRDTFGLVYTGHPSKGLEPAISVVQLLRQKDPRFSLHVYGGHRLWGEAERSIGDDPGVIYHGLIGQIELAQQMQKYGFSLNLQAREEPFGMVLIEAMRAGCVVIASSVGAFPEIIHHGHNGFLIQGNAFDKATHLKVAAIILELIQHPDYCNYLTRNAKTSPFDWNTIAGAWQEHWNWAIQSEPSASTHFDLGTCSTCGADWLPLADGLHCTGCGRYRKSVSS